MDAMQVTRSLFELYGGPEDGRSLAVPNGTAEVRVPCELGRVRAVYAFETGSSRFVFVGYLEAD
jgi:hypothetical protein